jgi:hypothetical protein
MKHDFADALYWHSMSADSHTPERLGKLLMDSEVVDDPNGYIRQYRAFHAITAALRAMIDLEKVEETV